MVPLFRTNTRSTTVTKLRGCSNKLQGSSKVGIQDILVFLICLMCWGGRLFLKGDSTYSVLQNYQRFGTSALRRRPCRGV